jgi:hypothetical protein
LTTRAVRFDEEAERALADVQRLTGLSIAGAIKLSLISYRDTRLATQRRRPSDFFAGYDFGTGGDALGPARASRRLVRNKLSAQLKRQRSN